jgi:hypothetical protein
MRMLRGHELLAFAARHDMSQGRWIKCRRQESLRHFSSLETPLREGSAALIMVSMLSTCI